MYSLSLVLSVVGVPTPLRGFIPGQPNGTERDRYDPFVSFFRFQAGVNILLRDMYRDVPNRIINKYFLYTHTVYDTGHIRPRICTVIRYAHPYICIWAALGEFSRMATVFFVLNLFS